MIEKINTAPLTYPDEWKDNINDLTQELSADGIGMA